MNTKKNAIIVLSYNKQRQTVACLDSILSSNYDQNKIFCFDNGSKIEVYKDLKNKYQGINFNRIETNKGYSGGFNSSLKWVFDLGYTDLLFLTNDTRIVPNTFNEILITAEKTGAEFIAPTIFYLSKPNEIDSIGGFFNPEKGTLHHLKDLEKGERLDGDWDYIPGTALWLKKNVFDSLNGIDESYHTYWEDVDFSFRARNSGIKLAGCKNGKVLHGVGKTCHKKPEYTTYFFQRNRIRFCKKFLKGKELENCLSQIKEELEVTRDKLEKKNDIRRLEYIKKIFMEL